MVSNFAHSQLSFNQVVYETCLLPDDFQSYIGSYNIYTYTVLTALQYFLKFITHMLKACERKKQFGYEFIAMLVLRNILVSCPVRESQGPITIPPDNTRRNS